HDVRAESPLHPGLSRRDLHPWHGQRLPVVRDLDGDPRRSGEVRARVLDALCHGSAPFVPPLTTANISGPPRQDEGPSGVSARAPPVRPARGSARQLEEVLSCSLALRSADSPSSDTEFMICCSAGTISLCHWPRKRSASGPVQSTSARPLVSSCSILVISSAAARSCADIRRTSSTFIPFVAFTVRVPLPDGSRPRSVPVHRLDVVLDGLHSRAVLGRGPWGGVPMGMTAPAPAVTDGARGRHGPRAAVRWAGPQPDVTCATCSFSARPLWTRKPRPAGKSARRILPRLVPSSES